MKKSEKTDNSQLKTDNSPVPGWCIVLEGYLAGWAPAPSYHEGITLKTSQEIADDLSEMMEIPIDTVTTVMAQLGFRTHFIPYGAHGWMMRQDPTAIYTIRPASPDLDS